MIGMKVEDRLDGTRNFMSWKPRVLLILEENDLLKFVNEKVPEPEAEEEKSQWRKSDAKARRISGGLGQRSLSSASLRKEDN